MDEETSADAPLAGEVATAPQPAHLAQPDAPEGESPSRRRWWLPALLVPVVIVVVLIIAWAVDTSPGEVMRNVELAGVDIGGLTEDELTGRVGDVADGFAGTPVVLSV